MNEQEQAIVTKQKTITFSDLGLSENLLAAVTKKGFTIPSPIQAGVIPLLLKGNKDIIGQAQTGTGKTAAFALPLLDLIDPNKKEIQAIIMTPTRELAIQVAEEISSFAMTQKATVLTIYGGNPMRTEIQGLKGKPTIVVGTPGRIQHHIRTNTLKLGTVDYFILDEADEMLNVGFRKEIEEILKLTPKQRRVLLFSATMPKSIIDIAKTHMKDHDIVRVAAKEMTNENISQKYYQVAKNDRVEALWRIISAETDFYAIVFCRTRHETDKVAKKLRERGLSVGCIHGDIDQKKRQRILAEFKQGSLKILVATDVAARGIDVSELNFVVNFTIPETFETYTHRIGRTGRAGNKGVAITFIADSEMRKLRFFEKNLKLQIEKAMLPKAEDILAKKKAAIIERIEHIIDNEDTSDMQGIAKMLLEEGEPQQVVAALLKDSYRNEFKQSNYEEIKEQEARSFQRGPVRRHRSSSFQSPTRKKRFSSSRGSQGGTARKSSGNTKGLKSAKRGKDAYTSKKK